MYFLGWESRIPSNKICMSTNGFSPQATDHFHRCRQSTAPYSPLSRWWNRWGKCSTWNNRGHRNRPSKFYGFFFSVTRTYSGNFYRPVADTATRISKYHSGYQLQGEIGKKEIFDLFNPVILPIQEIFWNIIVLIWNA